MTNQTWEEGVNLHHLHVFLKVAEYEHVTRAAEELLISQSAVTKIVQQLEHEVGLELIEQHGRHIVLTYAGSVLTTYARRLFALEREMEEALVDTSRGRSGRSERRSQYDNGCIPAPTHCCTFSHTLSSSERTYCDPELS